MNSFLQQLFHIPDFRRGLLTLELDGAAKEPPPPPPLSSPQGQQQQRGRKEEEKEGSDKSLLLELQALFALLQTSERKSADTLAFCRTLTEGSGEPLLLHEQKDVDEFLTVLFAKLEALDPRMERLLKGLFEGTMVNQIISHECPHRSEREEPFLMLKVDVKNMGSLEDSLELYVAGELLSGDNKYACRYVRTAKGRCVCWYFDVCKPTDKPHQPHHQSPPNAPLHTIVITACAAPRWRPSAGPRCGSSRPC